MKRLKKNKEHTAENFKKAVGEIGEVLPVIEGYYSEQYSFKRYGHRFTGINVYPATATIGVLNDGSTLVWVPKIAWNKRHTAKEALENGLLRKTRLSLSPLKRVSYETLKKMNYRLAEGLRRRGFLFAENYRSYPMVYEATLNNTLKEPVNTDMSPQRSHLSL